MNPQAPERPSPGVDSRGPVWVTGTRLATAVAAVSALAWVSLMGGAIGAVRHGIGWLGSVAEAALWAGACLKPLEALASLFLVVKLYRRRTGHPGGSDVVMLMLFFVSLAFWFGILRGRMPGE